MPTMRADLSTCGVGRSSNGRAALRPTRTQQRTPVERSPNPLRVWDVAAAWLQSLKAMSKIPLTRPEAASPAAHPEVVLPVLLRQVAPRVLQPTQRRPQPAQPPLRHLQLQVLVHRAALAAAGMGAGLGACLCALLKCTTCVYGGLPCGPNTSRRRSECLPDLRTPKPLHAAPFLRRHSLCAAAHPGPPPAHHRRILHLEQQLVQGPVAASLQLRQLAGQRQRSRLLGGGLRQAWDVGTCKAVSTTAAAATTLSLIHISEPPPPPPQPPPLLLPVALLVGETSTQASPSSSLCCSWPPSPAPSPYPRGANGLLVAGAHAVPPPCCTEKGCHPWAPQPQAPSWV